MKIVTDDRIPFIKGVLEPYAEIVYLPGDRIDNAALKNANALLVRSITLCNEKLLKNTLQLNKTKSQNADSTTV